MNATNRAAHGVTSSQTSVVIRQLIQDGRILKRGRVLRDGLTLGHRTQQAPHDLARTRLGQVVTKTDVLVNWGQIPINSRSPAASCNVRLHVDPARPSS